MKDRYSTIRDAEAALSDEIQALVRSGSFEPIIPQNVHVRAVFHHADGKKAARKIRESADFETNFAPLETAVVLTFEPAPTSSSRIGENTRYERPGTEVLAALIRALDRAESRPGYTFVAFKWFRDVGMSVEPALAHLNREALLREAIDQGIVQTGKVPNPKNPNFPVASVRLNRSASDVQTVLRASEPRARFAPVSISGEPLSETILRERR
ncbi:MAG TPA: hypothetical protein VMF11_09330 [Candidatus Baltobacteraceae bacterium]|nr:hypothetical protein [Candidatus Baltobacteraceae bacterium]